MVVDERGQLRKLARDAALECREDFHCGRVSSIIEERPCCVAPFERNEIKLGCLVGSGAFSDVYAIESFSLQESTRAFAFSADEIKKREHMAQNATRYVLKHLKPDLETSSVYVDAARDIMYESEMLSNLDHANIISLHGISASRHDAFLAGSDAFFLIIDRLEETLNERIKSWPKETSGKATRASKVMKRLGSRDNIQVFPSPVQTSMEERVDISISLASAMKYLHENNIIFRDLKPQNIGIDSQGNLKLFDFGLSRMLPSAECADTEAFEMSGAGTPRYSAPEVLSLIPYNIKADVYSFAIVVWEILSLKLPFSKFDQSIEKFYKAIIFEGKRPIIDSQWPRYIQEMFRNSFSSDFTQRPSMCDFLESLDKFLCDTRNNRKPNKRNSLKRQSSNLRASIKEVINRKLSF